MTIPEDVNLEEAPIEQAGAYRLVAPIAAGGFGVVFRAEHVEWGTPAAVKIMHAEHAMNPTAVLRFEREVEAIQRIRHPGVIEIREHGRLADGRPYFVMDLLTGTSLKEHLDASGRLDADEALAILEPLCAAVTAAHERAIVHRDIKASNVFLADEGGRRRVILLDFGVAKLLDEGVPGLTASRHVVGSASCMAPEQVLGRPVTERTDVYALGVLAYRALTGVQPFTARTARSLQQLHTYAPPRPPSTVAPVSPAYNDVLLRALAKNPAERHPSAAALLADLKAAAGMSRAPRRRVLGVFVQIHVTPEALEAPSDSLLADLDDVLPLAISTLAQAGFETVLETSTAVLLALARAADPAEDARRWRQGLRAVVELAHHVRTRPGADPAVRVHLYVHAGELALHDGAAISGDLLQTGAWVPEIDATWPLVSREALAELAAGSAPPGGAGGWSDLREALAGLD